MKTKFTLIAILLFVMVSFQQALSQTPIFLGLKGGIGIPNLHSSSNGPAISQGYSSRRGPYFGVFGEFRLTPEFSIQPEINYSSQGGKKNGQQTTAIPAQMVNPQAPSGTMYYVGTTYKSVAKLNYIEVPVLAKFTFPLSSHFNFIVDAGPYAGFLIRANQSTTGSNKVYMDQQQTQPIPGAEQPIDSSSNIKDQLRSINLGVQAGIGFSYNLGSSYIFIEGGGNYGLINIQKNTQEDGKNNTGAATIAIGYALRIN